MMDCPLHPRAVEAIRWLSFGKTFRETADLMKVKPMTIHRHLVKAKDAAGASNTIALVSAAIRKGWVQ